ncbi:hypothetical protein BZL30_9427 [Mycobacterium kansasii]|uniref:Uncharacterized protein n=1 Tax=Mycobacterium kansasii TaxID=1768 RepID=A0A1V3W9G9_MYCKA|nr:hypothetical protein BZL30_9427 [Mycobacterium kansasii]
MQKEIYDSEARLPGCWRGLAGVWGRRRSPTPPLLRDFHDRNAQRAVLGFSATMCGCR